MLALWSCGRRADVVQAQRQIHRALRAAITIAETIVRTIAEQAPLAVPMRKARIGCGGSEYHLVRGFSAPFLQAALQCPQPMSFEVAQACTLPSTALRLPFILCLEGEWHRDPDRRQQRSGTRVERRGLDFGGLLDRLRREQPVDQFGASPKVPLL